MESKYCEYCGHLLNNETAGTQTRYRCINCNHLKFYDPKLAVAVLILIGSKLVMMKRGVEPELGRWAFPSGFVDRGEIVQDAAIREVLEETGLDISIDGLIGLYSLKGNPVALAVYAGQVRGGSLRPGTDATEVALFSPSELPPLPFPHDLQIIEDWKVFLGKFK